MIYNLNYKFIEDSKIDSCYASDDGAAIHFKSGEIYKSVSFYRNANSYFIYKDSSSKIIEEKIPQINLI